MKRTNDITSGAQRSALYELAGKPAHMPASRVPRLLLALGVVLGACSTAIQAQTWDTVDDILPPASAYGITSDSAGNIFVAGSITDATGRKHAVIMKSGDSGATWDTSADIDPGETTPQTFLSAIGSGNVTGGERHLVAAGWIKRVFNASGAYSGQWLVVRSKNAGATWETVDEYTHPTYSQLSVESHPGGAAVDSSGNIYVAGTAQQTVVTVKGKTTTTTYVNHWLIRKGVPAAGGAVQWTTTDLAYPTSKYHQAANVAAMDVACVGNDVYAVGGGGTDGNYWRVMKTNNGGTTWTVADNFKLYTGDLPSLAHSIAADSAGNLYVAGTALTAVSGVTKAIWIVRKGLPGGTNWTTVDQFQYSGGNAWGRSVTVAPNGDVHVTGNARVTTDRWLTRQRSAATGLWSTTEDFSLATTGDAFGMAITADPFGNVYSAGRATDSGAVQHGWIVRRKLVP